MVGSQSKRNSKELATSDMLRAELRPETGVFVEKRAFRLFLDRPVVNANDVRALRCLALCVAIGTEYVVLSAEEATNLSRKGCIEYQGAGGGGMSTLWY